MDHVGVVVGDLEAAVAFFLDLGMELEGRAPIEGQWVDRVSGLEGRAGRRRHAADPRRPRPPRTDDVPQPRSGQRCAAERPGEHAGAAQHHVRRRRHRRHHRGAAVPRRGPRR
ncbi:VOC family protein [Kocuria cellulosilytica]|uniref:VOC family protein n=1 Tax=Kocuria cellulosilytica TaxID=3071451 RepID=UPI0034D3DD24